MSERYPVKWYTQDMQGAPQMSGGSDYRAQEPGKLTALLKQVLVTGFGLLAVDSLTYDSASGEVTATISGGHSYLKDSVLLIEGANEAAFNGEQRVTFVNATQFRYVPATPPAVAAATGTLSAKVAPAGWEVVAEDTSGEVMIFGSTDPEAGYSKLLVRNTADHTDWYPSSTYYKYNAQTCMVEDVTDIDNYSPGTWGVWPASTMKAPNEWLLVADAQLMYFNIKYGNKKSTGNFVFGEIISVRPADKYAAIINFANTDDWYKSSSDCYSNLLGHQLTSYHSLARPYHQLAGATEWKTVGLFEHMGTGIPLPNPADNGFYLGVDRIPILESDNTLRGYLPGVVNPYNDHPGLVDRNHDDIPSYPGKIIRFTKGTYNTSSSEGLIGFDLTGPWR